MQPSDIRLKRDISSTASKNSIGLYGFRYKWRDHVYVGVMAQEVAEIVPEAARATSDGYLCVNCQKLGRGC